MIDEFLINDVIDLTLNQLGYNELRQGQREPVYNLLREKNTFVILPTGAGKSLIYALVCKAANWKTIVFSPLVALMQDQVQSMCRKGVRAAALSSQTTTTNPITLQEWRNGELEMLYVAPERLDNPEFISALEITKPDFVVLDEAHCMSKWSATFRPKYARCGELVQKYNPKAVVALTATATTEIIADVRKILNIPDAVICRHYPARTNLILKSSRIYDSDLNRHVLAACREVTGSVIVYCATVKQVIELTSFLQNAGESVTFYHGQITNADIRTSNMKRFMSGECRICVATNAFGMGIDKPDIEAIIHAQCPSSVEAIAQETGRAARDGRKAICHMFDTQYGRSMQDWFFKMENPEPNILRRTYQFLCSHADSNNEVAVTIADMVKILQDVSVEGAINYMIHLGVIERYKPTQHTYKVVILKDHSAAPKNRAELLRLIQKYGTHKGSISIKPNMAATEECPADKYEIVIETLAELFEKPVDAIKRQFLQMRKEGYFIYDNPYAGSVTRILRELSSEDIEAAKDRWRIESKKIMDVRKYMSTPDDKKHEFLQEYFALA